MSSHPMIWIHELKTFSSYIMGKDYGQEFLSSSRHQQTHLHHLDKLSSNIKPDFGPRQQNNTSLLRLLCLLRTKVPFLELNEVMGNDAVRVRFHRCCCCTI